VYTLSRYTQQAAQLC